MLWLTKLINGSLRDATIFTLRDRPDYVFTFQEINKKWLWHQKPTGFYIECYEAIGDKKQVGYLFAKLKWQTLILNVRGHIPANHFLQNLAPKIDLKIEDRRNWKKDDLALRVFDQYSTRNRQREESKKGFGKLLIKMAVELGLYQYHLKQIRVHSLNTNFFNFYHFYCHILGIPLRHTNEWRLVLGMNLEKAWNEVNR